MDRRLASIDDFYKMKLWNQIFFIEQPMYDISLNTLSSLQKANDYYAQKKRTVSLERNDVNRLFKARPHGKSWV